VRNISDFTIEFDCQTNWLQRVNGNHSDTVILDVGIKYMEANCTKYAQTIIGRP